MAYLDLVQKKKTDNSVSINKADYFMLISSSVGGYQILFPVEVYAKNLKKCKNIRV
jgi:hypothetical protein